MAFWDAWFKPKCDQCEAKVELVSYEDRKICGSCHQMILDDLAAKEAEREARVAAEEAARAKLEARQSWGGDPRMDDG